MNQQADIVERLRVWPAGYGEDTMSSTIVGGIMKEAADQIEYVRAQLAGTQESFSDLAEKANASLPALVKALEPFANCAYADVTTDFDDHNICDGIKISDLKNARAALAAYRGEQ